MHISKDRDNFRNDMYIGQMEKEFRQMSRAYHKYIAYRNKLLKELTPSDEQMNEILKIDKKFIRQVETSNKRIQKEDFNVL